MENLKNLKGYTIISSEKYRNLIRKEKELEDLKYEHRVSERRFEMFKRNILNKYTNDYNLSNYDIEELLEISEYHNLFGSNLDKLFKLGFAYDELMEFIKEKKEEYDRKIGTSNESLQE